MSEKKVNEKMERKDAKAGGERLNIEYETPGKAHRWHKTR
jgi:hypothetical protein